MDKGKNCKKTYIISFLRVFLVVFVALVLPRFFFHDEKAILISNTGVSNNVASSTFKLGLENISGEFLASLSPIGKINSYTIGLITNHTGLDQKGNRNIDLLIAKGVRIKKIFVPEDDFYSYKKGVNWEMIDDHTQLPIVLLPHIDSLKKSKEYAFKGVDVIFFDLQDNGMSPSSHLTTLVKALQSAATQNKTVVVLDRPNMMGSSMEGILTSGGGPAEELLSIPMRHGMTFGELARYCNSMVLSNTARLFVVPMQEYKRVSFDDAFALSHASLFTNIDAYYGSSFLTILSSVGPFDIGIGTDLAFQCLALPEYLRFPKQKWFELRTILKQQGIETSWYRYANPKKQATFAGLRLMVRNIDQFSPFATIITILHFFKDAGIKLTYSSEFDRAFGGKKVRDFLDGKFSRHDLEHEVNKNLKTFYNKAQHSFIYKPAPRVVLL
jgi:uncharacterized protein YbbC (DUF1343 family)